MDLDTLTAAHSPASEEQQIFDPVNAWPGASSPIVVAVYRSGPTAVVQIGYDPDADQTWVRELKEPGQAWGTWKLTGEQPVIP